MQTRPLRYNALCYGYKEINTKYIITDKDCYECDCGRVHICYDDENEFYELDCTYTDESYRNDRTLFIPNSINGKAIVICGGLLDGMSALERFEAAPDDPYFTLYEGGNAGLLKAKWHYKCAIPKKGELNDDGERKE